MCAPFKKYFVHDILYVVEVNNNNNNNNNNNWSIRKRTATTLR